VIKINVEEYIRVCNLAKLVQVSNSKTNMFKTPDQLEGLELVNGVIIPFCIKTNPDNTKEKVIGQPVNSKDILAVLGAFEEKPKEVKEEKAKAKAHDHYTGDTKILNQEGSGIVESEPFGLLPDFLTSALMSKWAKMTTIDRILLFQKTPKDQIYQINVGKNPDTQKVEFAAYVKGNYMFKEANAAFLFDWNLSDVIITVCPSGVSVSAKLNAWFGEYNKYLSRPAVGYQEINKKIDMEQAKKGATTDAIKKGLSLFGFNSDVYSGEV